MNRNGFAIVVPVHNVETAIVQGRSLRIMSRAWTIALTGSNLMDQRLKDAYDEVVEGDPMDWVAMDRFSAILWMDEGLHPMVQMDRIFLTPMPAHSAGAPRLILIEPSRFILRMLDPGSSNVDLIRILDKNGLTWSMIETDGILSATPGPALSMRANLMEHLGDLLEPILGDTRDILKSYAPLFLQAFITKEANPGANYDLMEAYGDRFLGGQYSWLLLETPGVMTPDQVTKISSYFQDKVRLAQLAEYLGLVDHIVLARGQALDPKIQSDVVESLIAAIGITWQKARGRGNWAMKTFVLKIFNTYFHIDPSRYRILYENPKTRLKELVEALSLDRTKLTVSPPQEQDGEILVVISYDRQPIGYGRVKMMGLYRDTVIAMADRAAHQDALERESLQRLISSR